MVDNLIQNVYKCHGTIKLGNAEICTNRLSCGFTSSRNDFWRK